MITRIIIIDKWYTHTHTHPHYYVNMKIDTVMESRGVLRVVMANRPDIIIKNKEKTCLLINVVTPADRNVIQKEAEKKIKFNS